MKELPRKALVSLALAAGISAPIANPALAAELTNLNGQTCDGEGAWHFVNNQTGGAAAGMLTAEFSTGIIGPISPYKVLNSTQHFSVDTVGNATLLGAETNLPGRLQLSDFSCTTKPPVCEPSKEVCDGVDNDCDGKVDEGLTCK